MPVPCACPPAPTLRQACQLSVAHALHETAFGKGSNVGPDYVGSGHCCCCSVAANLEACVVVCVMASDGSLGYAAGRGSGFMGGGCAAGQDLFGHAAKLQQTCRDGTECPTYSCRDFSPHPCRHNPVTANLRDHHGPH